MTDAIQEDQDTPAEAEDKKRRLPPVPAWLVPALPMAVLGVAGVLAGGGASYLALAGQASSQQRVAEARNRAVANGTARLMDVEFRGRADVMAAAARSKRHPTTRISLATRISIADQRLVASTMSAPSWARVADAMAGLARARAVADHHRGARLTATDLTAARTLRVTFRRASAALAAFASPTTTGGH